jgi:AAA family ATP:ADP antiporter
MVPRDTPGERVWLLTLAVLFFAGSMVEASNEVVATSGFISHLGASHILWLWAADALIVILAVSAYALIVDRTNRRRLTIVLFAGFGAGYVVVFGLFVLGAPDGVTYTTLKLMNSQQDNLLPLVLGALAADVFTLSESKRLFGLLAGAEIVGELAGNGLAVGVVRLLNGNAGLLLCNAAWLCAGAVVLSVAVRRITPPTRQAHAPDRLVDVLRDGLVFVREVALFRYLTLSMFLLGIGWTVLQYQFFADLAATFPEAGELQFSYGSFKIAIIALLLVVQTVGLRWLMRWAGFRSIFTVMPGVLLVSLTFILAWPGLLSVVFGWCLAQVTEQGINDPSEQSFLGLVPDELRGRIGAFLYGVLYQVSYLLGYILIGAVLLLARTPETGRLMYLSLGWAGVVVALWAALRIRTHYEEGLLNWRFQRRRRGGVQLPL